MKKTPEIQRLLNANLLVTKYYDDSDFKDAYFIGKPMKVSGNNRNYVGK